MQFTLVSTVFNEISRLGQTIADIEAQSLPPDQIVITDAGSNDGTYEKLIQWKAASLIPILILREKGCNVARGRNLAIEAAQYDLIVSTDFGCRFHPKWLESIISEFRKSESSLNSKKNGSETLVAGGTYTVTENSIQTFAAKANYILTRAYKLDVESWFIPSSRSIAYFKKVWDEVGGYPEWLTLAGDDLVFGMKLRAKGYKWAIVDKPYVYWLRHQNANGYSKESFRYGLGDGEARVNLRNSTVLLAETLLRYSFLPALVFILTGHIWFFCIVGITLAGFRPYWNTLRNWLFLKSDKYNFGIFLYSLYLLERNRFSYLKGYFKGYFLSNSKVKAERAKLKAFLNHQ